MERKAKRVLFFAEAVTLAHIARCAALAGKLHKTGHYTIGLAADERYDSVVGDVPFERIPLHSISSRFFFKKLAKGDPVYDVKTLTAYVEEDLKVMDDFEPEFIFGDFRLSLAISCKLKNIPYAAITNAYWSPYADIFFPIPEIPLVKILGVSIAQILFNRVKPVIFFIHSLAFNKTCKKFGLPPLAYDMREIYTHADFTLYADFQSIIPMKNLPGNHLFIGPVLWSAQVPLPDWWLMIPDDKPCVFVTMGSSGDSDLLTVILKGLSELPITTICVTAQKKLIEHDYKNVFMTTFIPVKEAVEKADIVICNGGSPMVYQSLLENKAVIGIPGNLDQYLMMDIIVRAQKGQLIRSGKITPGRIKNAVKKALSASQGNGKQTGAYTKEMLMLSDIQQLEMLIQDKTMTTGQ